MKKTILYLLLIFNYNCTQMEKAACFSTQTFTEITKLIQEKGSEMISKEHLVMDKSMNGKEYLVGNFYLILMATNDQNVIIIADKNHQIPSFTCSVNNNELIFSAYESRLDTKKDSEQREKIWCELASELL